MNYGVFDADGYIDTNFFAGVFGIVPGTWIIVYCPPQRCYVINLKMAHAWVCPVLCVN